MRETMPWERQKNESHQAFEAFHEYCLLGADRSIRKVAQSLNKSVALLGKWSSKWKWIDRAAEYDNELVRQEVQTAKKEIAEMRKRQIEIGQYFQSKGIEAIRRKVKEDDSLKSEEIRDLMNLVSKGMQMETDARLSGLEAYTGENQSEHGNTITAERRKELEDFFNE